MFLQISIDLFYFEIQSTFRLIDMNKAPVFAVHMHYLISAGCLFLLEITIASMVHDRYIRPFGGDFLVVIFLYCLVRGITNLAKIISYISVLAFAYLIETLQYFQFIRVLGLENIPLARVIIGTQFSWEDMVAYTAGIAFVILIETKLIPSRQWNTL